MRRETLVTGLICLNLGLVAVLAYVWTHRPPAAAQTSASQTAPERKSEPRVVTIKTEGSTAPAAAKFTWRSLADADLKKYIANLRAVGCPEPTIQDIILAAIQKQYAAKEAGLKLRPELLKPWESAAASNRERFEKQKQLRELLRQKRALIKELLGLDIPEEMPAAYATRDTSRYEQAYSKLPPEKRDLVRGIQDTFWDKSDELRFRTHGFWEPEDREESRKIREERRQGLAKLLTAQELDDFELNSSSTAAAMRSQLSAFQPTDKEFREVFRLRRQLEEQFDSSTVDPADREATQKRAEAYQQMDDQIKTALGETRYAEYKRSQDYNFHNLSRIAEQNGLSKEAAIKAYDLNRLAQQQAANIRMNANLTLEQRQAQLQTVQAQTDQAMTEVMGAAAFEAWQRSGAPRIYFPGISVRGAATDPGTPILVSPRKPR